MKILDKEGEATMNDITANKHGGNAQSAAAFERAKRGFNRSRQDILDLLKLHPAGLTCKEMSTLLGKPMHKLSGRITELKELGQLNTTETIRAGGAVVVLIADAPVALTTDDLADCLLDEEEAAADVEENYPA
jgi:hypothetical protein